VGPLGPSIAGFAKQLGCDTIIMGTRGMGSVTGALLGSVSTDVIRCADVPVTLVK
jgi:nucleotide-binding universal stress UspA family protein